MTNDTHQDSVRPLDDCEIDLVGGGGLTDNLINILRDYWYHMVVKN